MRSDYDPQEIAEHLMAAHCHQLVTVKEKYTAVKLMSARNTINYQFYLLTDG